jgi:hypothetical protein
MASLYVDPTALTMTRQPDERLREQWLWVLVRKAILENLSFEEVAIAVYKSVVAAMAAGNIRKKKAAYELSREGRLAAHPDVRDHFERLVALRDQLWASHASELKPRLHGPSQVLVDLMMCQRNPQERHHAASVTSYLLFRCNLPPNARRPHFK